MGQFLGCLFFAVFGIVFMLLGAVRNIVRALLHDPLARQGRTTQAGAAGSRQRQGTSRPNSRSRRAQKSKIFGKDEGEYVDFEEIRD